MASNYAPVASESLDSRDILLIGEPVKLDLPSLDRKIQMAENNHSGMVNNDQDEKMNNLRNRQSACLVPKSVMLAHGTASETERISVGYESLNSSSQLKIQSIPLGKLRGSKEPIRIKLCVIIQCTHHNVINKK